LLEVFVKACNAGGDREQYAGFPHSDEPETPMRWSPVTWIPMKRDPESSEVKGRGLDQIYQAQ